MISLLDDFRFALRLLRKNPGFTCAAVLTMALGIGANTAMFSVVNGVLLRPLPYAQPDRLVWVSESWPDLGRIGPSYLNFRDWSALNQSFESIAAYRGAEMNFTGSGEAERLDGQMVSAAFFQVLGVQPIFGRTFLENEDRPGGPPVAVISEGLWKRRFGGDPDILQRSAELNGTLYRIVGVVPSSFNPSIFPSRPRDVFVPLGQWTSPSMAQRMYHPGIQAIARLKPGVAIERARADMNAIGAALANQYPKEDGGHSVAVLPLKDALTGQARPVLWLLLGAVGFVLLIACANLANLLLSRAAARQQEMSMRIALGARRLRIVRQLLTEAVMLSLLGGAAGLLLAAWGVDLILTAVPSGMPRIGEIRVDGGVLAFTLAASVLTGILAGLGPALQLCRPNLRETLARNGKGIAGTRQILRNVLVMGEVALALVLIAGTGLMIQSIWKLSQVDPGLDPRSVLLAELSLSPAKTSSAAAIRTAYDRLIGHVEHMPGAEAAAALLDVPFEDSDQIPLYIDGQPRAKSVNEMPLVLMFETTPGYLDAMKVPLRRGRFFTDHDDANSPPVAVIDEFMAATMFRGQDPLGKRITLGAPDLSFTVQIVGIVGHIKTWGLDEAITASKIRPEYGAQVYLPFAQMPDFIAREAVHATVAVRTRSNPLGFFNALKTQIAGIDPNEPVYNPRTMEGVVENTLGPRKFTLWLLGAFGAIALLLASIGIYGVISYTVSQRTREIGIRAALGARRHDILKSVLGRSLVLALMGVGIGIIGGLLITRVMAKMLYGVTATDPVTFAAAAAVLTGVALLAAYLPARRAASVDPMSALRYE
ncbi:MAG TPA: ABC transporter permease [Bryobacteraceae bacterium]|nr:ABC transporter permease [Bryobacteraceae bacterium]